MSWSSFLMDLATIPEYKTDSDKDDEFEVVDPESEDELKALLGL